jgi:hypothetical protein
VEYLARPVRVNTIRDWHAERAMLHEEIASLRGHVALKEMPLKSRATPTGGGAP